MEVKMAHKRITIMDISELIRRFRDGQKISHIASALGYDRKTVRKYIAIVESHSADKKKLPQDIISELSGRPARKQELLEPYINEIKELITNSSNPLKPKTAFEVICVRHNLSDKVSYSSFKRFIRTHRITLFPDNSTCRIEVEPASQAQVDYAKAGLLPDPCSGKRRTVYIFIGALSFSRHKYIEFTFRQTKQSFVNSHVKMFQAFGGVPKTIALDNLKSGVITPDLYDPRLNRAYREMAEHYNCFIDPCRVASPKDKGKVERDVQTVREQFRKLAAINPNIPLAEANAAIQKWMFTE